MDQYLQAMWQEVNGSQRLRLKRCDKVLDCCGIRSDHESLLKPRIETRSVRNFIGLCVPLQRACNLRMIVAHGDPCILESAHGVFQGEWGLEFGSDVERVMLPVYRCSTPRERHEEHFNGVKGPLEATWCCFFPRAHVFRIGILK